MSTPVREVPRESAEWAAVSVTTKAGAAVDAAAVRLAVLPKGIRPTGADWTSAVVDPDGTAAYGVDLDPVPAAEDYGVWVDIATTGGRSVVLDPDSAGYVIRT